MARFEMTLSNGERVLVDHASADMAEIVAELNGKGFILLQEIRGESTSPPREVIVARSQITVVRAMESDSRQSTTFRPKR